MSITARDLNGIGGCQRHIALTVSIDSPHHGHCFERFRQNVKRLTRGLTVEGVIIGGVADAQPVPVRNLVQQIGSHQNIARHKIGAARDAETRGHRLITGRRYNQVGQINGIAIGIAAGKTARHHACSPPW